MRFEREELFFHYHQNTNPFIIITVSINVTNIVNYCRKNKNFYATMGYLIAKAVNQIDAFKWRYEENEFHYYETVFPNFTQKLTDNKIGYFDCIFSNDYEKFLFDFQKVQNEFYQTGKNIINGKKGSIWLSCLPWFPIQSLIPPFDRNNTTPQFIWDKYIEEKGTFHMNLMILAHHGFVDGYHISKFLEILQKEIDNFQKIESL